MRIFQDRIGLNYVVVEVSATHEATISCEPHTNAKPRKSRDQRIRNTFAPIVRCAYCRRDLIFSRLA